MKSDCSGQKGQKFHYKGSSVKDSGYDIRTQTWMTKKKKSRPSKDCIKELLRYRNCWLRAELVFRAPVWIQTSMVLPTPSCLLNLSLVLHQLSLISWSSLKSSVTSSGADVSPCLIPPVLPTILGTWISSAFSSITM